MAAALSLAAAFATAGCARGFLSLGKPVEAVAPDSLELNLVLIGDAGLPAPGGEPVMKALRREVSWDPKRTFVVFMGDNVYPRGMVVDSTAAERRENERIINDQMAPLLETGTRGVFVPGNHDWAAGTEGGWDEVRTQERYVLRRGGSTVDFQPRGGCPGPVVMDMGATLRLIILDTEWWIQPPEPRPHGARATGCRAKTEEEVVDSLRVDLARAGNRRTVVVAHHPVVSGGEHGGYFDWPTYLFPLHPWARLSGLMAKQDVTGRNYRLLSQSLERAFAARPPLVYAAGHEHNLQVLRRAPAKWLLVSGGGIYNHTTATRAITGTQYTRRASGFMRLSFLRDGRVRLAVLVVDAQGNATEDYSAWIETERLPAAAPGAAAAPLQLNGSPEGAR